MKKLFPVFQTIFGCLCLTLSLFVITNAQSTPTDEKERKIRYITNNKSKVNTRPKVIEIKGGVGRAPKKDVRKLKAGDNGLEQIAFKLINEKRSEKGLKPLKWSNKLAKVARLHSENMAKHNFFNHVGLEGKLVDDRALLFGVKKWQAIGENIAYNKGIPKPANFAVKRWMLSNTHRNNLLDERWVESGLGVAITEDGFHYFTQVFLVK